MASFSDAVGPELFVHVTELNGQRVKRGDRVTFQTAAQIPDRPGRRTGNIFRLFVIPNTTDRTRPP